MLKYSPLHRKYAVDEQMRQQTQQIIRTRVKLNSNKVNKRNIRMKAVENPSLLAVRKYFKEAKIIHGSESYLCGDLVILDHKLKLVDMGHNHGTTCKVCGVTAHPNLTICRHYLHLMDSIG